jgi:L-ascorbate metabolism protein UlaG (beta-lactamase superfamily)
VIPSSAGAITVHPVSHATFRLDVAGGPTLWLDPVTSAGALDGKGQLVLVTDIHQDHMDKAGIEAVSREGTVVVVPPAVADALGSPPLPGLTRLANGESLELTLTVDGKQQPVKIEAVPMYNLVRGPEQGQLFHEKGRGNGYVLTIGDARIYVSGDTECTDEMKALTDIDAAFVCMNLPYTMPPEEAAACVAAFKPTVVYPYHYRGSDLAAFSGPVSAAGVEVRTLEWYPQ